MMTFLTTLLSVSIVGMVLLLVLKHYELRTGRLFLGSLRPIINRVFFHMLHFVEEHLPALMRANIERVFRFTVGAAHRFVAQVLLYVEYWLQRALDLLHLTTHIPHTTTPASAFLREVAAHKKNLLKRIPDVSRHGVRERVVVQE